MGAGLINRLFYFVKEILSDAWGIVRSPRKGLESLYHVSLYRNAAYVMMNNLALGLTGFFFWIAAARLYPTDQVGVASAAVAAMLLLADVSLFGLDYAIVRYIVGAGSSAKDLVNSCLTLTGVTSTILSLIFIAGLSFWSPGLHVIREQPLFFATFVVSTLGNNVFLLVQRVCIGQLRSDFVLAMGLVFGLSRFIPLAIMASSSSSLGIFASFVIATWLAVAVGVVFLVPRVVPRYRPSLKVRGDLLAPMVHYALGNFVANVSLTIIGYVLPVVVLNVLGAEKTAYFYVTWTFSGIVASVVFAVTINLFAAGSNDPQRLKYYVKRSVKLMAVLLVPTITLTLLLGDKFLLAFGEGYSRNGTHLLWLLMLAAVPFGINMLYIAVMRVGSEMKWTMAITIFVAIATLGSSPFLLSRMGLIGVGVAWLASQGVVAIFTGRQILKAYFVG